VALLRLQPIAGAPKARFTQLRTLDVVARAAAVAGAAAAAVKDLKIFLRDVSQWSQLLLLLALVLIYSTTSACSICAHSVHERLHQERLRVRQPRDGGFVMATVAVRFVVSAVSAEGRRSGSSARRRSRCTISSGRSSGPASCRCSC
jgi:ABC-2 type transport system permease protein